MSLDRWRMTQDEQATIERIFLRHIDEDDAMSIIQDLLADGFFIISRRLLDDALDEAGDTS